MTCYLVLDGDGVGDRLERCVLEDDDRGLSVLSDAVDSLVGRLSRRLTQEGGAVLVCGGDSVLARFAAIPEQRVFDELAATADPVTVSVGVGDTLRQAWMALKFAKTMKPAIVRLCDDTFLRLDGSSR